ncbi:MAG: aminodeoxychorismate/anthranilate synthase component II [Actinomycetota bacterium]|jgi:anthranilate synthase/aminodeoxychorismate synthase-like glutamine amidotransferase|nr:aminodeoxychorismate/anthranilate synthase component II [Actinomycetota bacterium]
MAPRVLVVDNYDSFTYNLVQYLGKLGAAPTVVRNDAVDVDWVVDFAPDCVLVSPGPGRPEDAGISMDVIRVLGSSVPVLGVCLGHQCIAQVFGASIVRAPQVMHGRTSEIVHAGAGVLHGLPSPFTATRYHSLVVDPSTVPPSLEITATTTDNVIMALRHRDLSIQGVQFHPESILTRIGYDLLVNFLSTTAHVLPTANSPGPV